MGYIKISAKGPLKLNKTPALLPAPYGSDEKYSALLAKNQEVLAEYQTRLYAGKTRALLIIFQGMDTSGKDGAIKHVMSGVNPQGCSVASFKAPTPEELNHDYLWRTNWRLPARGQIGIFNRSYYEDVLVPRVHPELLGTEKLPTGKRDGKKLWQARYRDITNHEKFLVRQGYEIVKIFIHISKDEQKRRLLDRFQDPKKLWKISEGDVHERMFWAQYQRAYEDCIRHTAIKHAPWYIVPGNDKKHARLAISQILVNRFEQMQLVYPELSTEQKKKLRKLKALLS